jgi:hypothetical protein
MRAAAYLSYIIQKNINNISNGFMPKSLLRILFIKTVQCTVKTFATAATATLVF